MQDDLFSGWENLCKDTYKPLDRPAYLGGYRLTQLRLCRLNSNKVHINVDIPADHINK